MPQRDKVARFLMDQDEGNLGGFTGGAGILPVAKGAHGKGEGKRVLNFEGESKYGRVLTVAVAAFLNPLNQNLATNFWGGPIVATLEFGNGGVWTTVEVDVPFGSAPILGSKNFNLEDATLVSLPASAVRVIARNDGGLVPVNIADVVEGDLRLDGIDGGAGFPGLDLDPNPVVVKAHIVEGTRSSLGRARRLFLLARYAAATAVVSVSYNIPPLAKTVRFLRDPIAAPVEYEFVAGINPTIILDEGTVPAGVSSPDIPVPSQANFVRVSIGGPGTTAAFADYEIGV